MNIYLQIIIYIITFVGLFLTVITFLDRKIINKDYKILDEEKKNNIEIHVITQNMCKKEINMVKNIIKKGRYKNIYNVAKVMLIKNKNIDM